MRVNFGTGLIVGVMLASALIVASSGAHSSPVMGPTLPTGGLVQYTAAKTETTTASSSTSASLTVSNPAALSNISSSVTNSVGATSQSGAGFSSATLAQPPSLLASIEDNPSRAPLLLLPVALAVALGLAFYLRSKPAE